MTAQDFSHECMREMVDVRTVTFSMCAMNGFVRGTFNDTSGLSNGLCSYSKWDHFDLGFVEVHDGKTRHKSSEGPRILVAVD